MWVGGKWVCGERDLVEAAAAEGVATQNPSHGERRTAQRAMEGDGGDCVIGTCGQKAAAAHAQRVHGG